jgi:hypothetical protein
VKINGECYPKCSKCSKVLGECACGSGSDPANYQITPIGKYCCTLNQESYDTIDSCKPACNINTSGTGK